LNTNTTVASNLNTQVQWTLTSATAANVVTSETAGPQNLNALGNVTATNVKGNYAASSGASFSLWTSGSFTPATATNWARFNLQTYKDFNSDPVVKVGDTVNYVSGWRWFATSAATIAATSGQSTVQTWRVVDNAVALTVSGVAAIVALSF
jgi:hypothetical protein